MIAIYFEVKDPPGIYAHSPKTQTLFVYPELEPLTPSSMSSVSVVPPTIENMLAHIDDILTTPKSIIIVTRSHYVVTRIRRRIAEGMHPEGRIKCNGITSVINKYGAIHDTTSGGYMDQLNEGDECSALLYAALERRKL